MQLSRWTLAVAAFGFSAAPCFAADRPNTVPKETCAAVAAPPPGMSGWANPTAISTATNEAGAAAARLAPGQAVKARLVPVAQVSWRVPPEKADGPPVYGGLFSVTIPEAGAWRLASSAAPWMDVFDGRTPAKTLRFGRGPACTGIGKMVEFSLQPGTYLVQISESLQPETELMVTRATP